MTTAERIQQVRAFNRFYTRIIGILGDEYLHTRWSLTEARVIFELATQGETTVADLRRSLGLDRGYLSRILSGFEAAGVVARERDERDGRRQLVRLTAAGHRHFSVLDRRSARNIGAMLGAHAEAEQAALVAGMGTIRRVLGDPDARADVLLAAPAPGDYGWVIQRHGALYAQEYGWDPSFEALVAGIVADYLAGHRREDEAAWIARAGDERLGSVFCVRKDSRTAQLRLLLVEPHARRLGIGTALVGACVAFASERGYRRLVLWTNDVLTDARRVYQRAGFRLEAQEPHHGFGTDLVGQHWALDLAGRPAPVPG